MSQLFFEIHGTFFTKLLGVPKNLNCLISCKLKTTLFTGSVFIFFKLSYFSLNFGIKQSKIG